LKPFQEAKNFSSQIEECKRILQNNDETRDDVMLARRRAVV
jgi:hypothetical protein